jgi:hypothetical protein
MVTTLSLTDQDTGEKIKVPISPPMLRKDADFLQAFSESMYITEQNFNSLFDQISVVSGYPFMENIDAIDWNSAEKSAEILDKQSHADALKLEIMEVSADFIPLKIYYTELLKSMHRVKSDINYAAIYSRSGTGAIEKRNVLIEDAIDWMGNEGYWAANNTSKEMRIIEQKYNFTFP